MRQLAFRFPFSVFRFSGEDDDDFAFDFFGGEVVVDFAQGAAGGFGIEFADLAADADLTLFTHNFNQLLQQLDEAEGTFVNHHCAALFGQPLDGRLATFLVRQESFEDESVARQAAVDEGGNEGCRTRQAFDVDIVLDGFAYKEKAGVADAGRAGVGDNGNVYPALQLFDESGNHLMFVEDVVALHRRGDAVVLHKHATGACVLGQDEVDRLKDFDGSIGYVAEVSDRCGYEIEFQERCIFEIKRIANPYIKLRRITNPTQLIFNALTH